jgi:uncharacterized protein (DUF1778 family)
MARNLRRKTERMDLRATQEQKQIIERASAIRQTSASEFMLQSAYAEAVRVLEEASRIPLDSQAWERFCAALDAPAQTLPGLQAFMAEPDDLFDPQEPR